jgi:hypothetical protein
MLPAWGVPSAPNDLSYWPWKQLARQAWANLRRDLARKWHAWVEEHTARCP